MTLAHLSTSLTLLAFAVLHTSSWLIEMPLSQTLSRCASKLSFPGLESSSLMRRRAKPYLPQAIRTSLRHIALKARAGTIFI
jgi:hypothetical protein